MAAWPSQECVWGGEAVKLGVDFEARSDTSD